MAYDSTVIEGIIIGVRNLAWIGDTRLKVIQGVKGWDGRTVDLAKISKRFPTRHGPAIKYEEILAAFAFYAQEQNRAICDQQIQAGEDTPVFNFWSEKQKNLYDAFMTPMPSGYLLLEGSNIAESLSPEAREYSGIRNRWVEKGWLVDNRLAVDIPFDEKGLRRMSSIVSGHPNSGTHPGNVHWCEDAGADQAQTLFDWKRGNHQRHILES